MKSFFAIFLFLALMLGMVGCGNTPTTPTEPSNPTEGTQAPTDAPQNAGGKYQLNAKGECIVNDGGIVAGSVDSNNRLYYQIFVGSFSDSNGDGIGDLRGIINRFDYLNDGDPNSGTSLGVEGIWLSPIFTSPSYHKYDVTDYYEIDPKFGTMEDLKDLIKLCHERDVQIILDLVINHTAKDNEWFENFVYAQQMGMTGNEYYNFYTWSEDRTGNATWYNIGGTDKYYEGNFSSEMPELNFDNPVVRQAMVDVAKFYLDLGVDGFRFDAAKYVYYGELEPNVQFWDWYMAELRSIKPDIYTVAEVWDPDAGTFPYFSSTNCFNFSMSQSSGRIAEVAKGGNVNGFVTYIRSYLDHIESINPNAFMVSFITNHDMDRAAGFLQPSMGHAQMAANLNVLLPGSSYIYYGEEIGMLGSRGGSNTDANRRLAMLWGDNDTVRDPMGASYKANQVNGTVADQLGKDDSLYNYYKKLVTIRKANPEIANGEMIPLKTNTKAGGFLCTYLGNTVAVLHNTSNKEVVLDLATLTDVPLETLAAFIGMGEATLEGTILTLAPQTSAVLR